MDLAGLCTKFSKANYALEYLIKLSTITSLLAVITVWW